MSKFGANTDASIKATPAIRHFITKYGYLGMLGAQAHIWKNTERPQNAALNAQAAIRR